METLTNIVVTINSYLSNYILLFLLVGLGILFSVRTKFVQVRCFGEGMKAVFGKNANKKEGGISKFQALTTAIAAQVGTGNIVGACGAILIGGPGAIFWMWIIAFFGMATIYAEAVLAQETKIVEADGSVLGGPVYYIRRAFSGKFGKFLAGFFAIAITLALGFFGCMVQSNSIGSTIETAFGIPGWIVGVVLVGICALASIGTLISPKIGIFITFSILVYAGYSVSLPVLQNMVAIKADPAQKNLVMGFYNSTKSLGSIAGSLTAGFIYAIHPKLPFGCTALIYGLGLVAAIGFIGLSRKKA